MEEKELYHHGVPGQKWGVRRYQRKDGSLTRLGEKHFKSVSKSKRAQKKQTKQAVKILDKYQKHYTKEQKKVDKKLNKLTSKSTETSAKIEKLKKKQQSITNDRNFLNTKISEISTGQIKAGRDFIVASNITSIPYVHVGLTGPRVSTIKLSKRKVIIKGVNKCVH